MDTYYVDEGIMVDIDLRHYSVWQCYTPTYIP